MLITRDYKISLRERVKSDPKFAASLMNEAVSALVHGEPELARTLLRELVNASVGFDTLAAELGKPDKSIKRMLAQNGNPTMNNMTNILMILQKKLKLDVEVKSHLLVKKL